MNRARPIVAVVLPSALLAAGWAGCNPEYPGDSLGGFRVHGDLVEQTCGVAVLMPNDPIDFRVELRRDGATMYWRRPGLPAMDGHYRERDGTFELSATSTFLLREAVPAEELGPCRITQQESIGGTLEVLADDADADGGAAPDATPEVYPDAGTGADGDAGAPAPRYRWSGENAVTFSVAAGADCRDRIGADVGQFPTLPCRIRYDLEAEPMEATPDW